MMFGGEKGRYSALISIIFSVLMVLMTIIPFVCVLKEFNLTLISFVSVLLLGVWFTLKSVNLYKNTDEVSAKRLMTSSLIYLPVLQIIFVLDKYLF